MHYQKVVKHKNISKWLLKYKPYNFSLMQFQKLKKNQVKVVYYLFKKLTISNSPVKISKPVKCIYENKQHT